MNIPPEARIDAVRATRKMNIPVVLTLEEVRQVIHLLAGPPQLIVKLLYGSGLQITEAVRLRIKDMDYEMKQVTVRSGKGARDRVTTFPKTIIPFLKNHLAKVKILHERDLAEGYVRYVFPLPFPINTQTRLRNGDGNMCSLPGGFRRTPEAARSGDIMWTPVW